MNFAFACRTGFWRSLPCLWKGRGFEDIPKTFQRQFPNLFNIVISKGKSLENQATHGETRLGAKFSRPFSCQAVVGLSLDTCRAITWYHFYSGCGYDYCILRIIIHYKIREELDCLLHWIVTEPYWLRCNGKSISLCCNMSVFLLATTGSGFFTFHAFGD